MACPFDSDAIRAGQVQLGFSLAIPAPSILEVVHKDWDWFFIDGQHGQLSYDAQLHAVRTADLVNTPSLVRVRDHSMGAIGPVLDMSCTGIVAPMVNSVQEAEQVVQYAKFPPLGTRSYGGRRVVDVGGLDYWETANEESLLFVQIETAQSLDNVEAIAETPGIDGVAVGPIDLTISLGMPRGALLIEPKIAQRIAQAAQTAGKLACYIGFRPAQAPLLAAMGYSLLCGGGDIILIRNASPALAADIREALS